MTPGLIWLCILPTFIATGLGSLGLFLAIEKLSRKVP